MEEFYPEYTRSPQPSTQPSTGPTPVPIPVQPEIPARGVNKRAILPKDDDLSWQNVYIDKINAFRERDGVLHKGSFSTEILLDHTNGA